MCIRTRLTWAVDVPAPPKSSTRPSAISSVLLLILKSPELHVDEFLCMDLWSIEFPQCYAGKIALCG